MYKTVCAAFIWLPWSVAAKKLLNKALLIRREHAGSLLQAARLMQSMELTDKNDFSEGFHMASTEPFFLL